MGEPSDNLHPRLIELMSRMEADRIAVDFDFIGYKDEIVGLHTQFPDEEHKVQAIVLYGMLINHTCDNIQASGGDATGLLNVALCEHKMFLIKEAQDSEGNIDPDELARVTRREIEAGRMDEDDGLAKLADAGSKVLGQGTAPSEKARPLEEAVRLMEWTIGIAIVGGFVWRLFMNGRPNSIQARSLQ